MKIFEPAPASAIHLVHTFGANGCVVHSFRHSLRDRLRAVQCPSDMIDQIGGWATAGIGQSYGEGYSIAQSIKQMLRIESIL